MFKPDIPPETLYVQIKSHLERVPEIDFAQGLNNEERKWVARALALLKAWDDNLSLATATVAAQTLDSYTLGPGNFNTIYLALATLKEELELRLPAGLSGTFISVGSSFDFHAAFSKIVSRAEKDVFLVDPYLDEKALTEFGESVAEGVNYRLLSDKAGVKANLGTAARKWVAQHGANRPIEVRLTAPKLLHDRLIVVDRKEPWSLTQSMKDFAARSPGVIVEAKELASLKIPLTRRYGRTLSQ